MPKLTTGSQNCASSLATMMSQGQISMSPPATTLPCTAAMVGLGTLRQRSLKPIDFFLTRHLRLGTRASETAPSADRAKLGHFLVRILLAQIVARGKVRTVCGKNNHFDVVVLSGDVEGVVQ